MKLHASTLRMNSFKEMALSPALMKALEKMAILKPTPIQGQAIPVGLAGSDLIAVAQTGSGKTLAFVLPILTTLKKRPDSRALILVPSREMALQIFKVLAELNQEEPFSSCLVIGGIPSSKQIGQLNKNPRLIVGTPGRLNDHLETNKLLLQNIEMVVIDEADRMLDMGFAPQLKNIRHCMKNVRQTLMFSASFGPSVETIAQSFMRSEVLMIRTAQAEEPVAALRQKVLLIDRKQKEDRLLDELNATTGGVIVFTGSQESCETVGEYLKSYGFETDLIHGGLTQGQRNRVVRDFRESKIRIMVATDLLARGLDVPHVDHVINFDLPFQSKDFLHRIGRTARAGRGGHAITFVTGSDTRMYKKIKEYLTGAEEIKVDQNFKFFEPKSERNSRTEKPSKSTRPTKAGPKAHPAKKSGPKKSSYSKRKYLKQP